MPKGPRLTAFCLTRILGRMTLREARIRRGLTMTIVAIATGIDKSILSRIERGERMPSRENARRLYAYFEGEVELGRIYDPEFKLAS